MDELPIQQGYRIEGYKCKLITIQDIRERLDEIGIVRISLDASLAFPNRIVKMCDKENPISFVDNVFMYRSLCVDGEYAQDNLKEIRELVLFICQNTKEDTIKIDESILITEEVIRAIINNPNIKNITLGNETDIYVLTEELYKRFKNSNLEGVKTYGVVAELEDNFDSLIEYNSKRYLIGFQVYESLASAENLSFSQILSDEEIKNLKYIKKDCSVTFSSCNYSNIFKAINRLEELGFSGKVTIDIDNKNDFNSYLFSHIGEIKDTTNISVYMSGSRYDFLTYMKYEKVLIDLVVDAMNLSPFEKYLYAYNVTKKFKKYKENEEDKQSARDLYQILDGEFMVCVGYSKLLGDLLDKLGIENYDHSVSVETGLDYVPVDATILPDFVETKSGKKVEIVPTSEGHARRQVHLVDPKYGIDGYYYTDPTWDNEMEEDSYNHALMTADEFVSLDRYNYLNTYGVQELFFVHSLEEFYEKINFLLDKARKKEVKDLIRSLIICLEDFDNELYAMLIEKYQGLEKYSFKFTKENEQDILLDIGERLVSKSNNLISGKEFREAITVLYRECYGITEPEELEAKVNEVIEYNKKRQAKCFPTRYKIGYDDEKMVLYNMYNKFDLEEQPNLNI